MLCVAAHRSYPFGSLAPASQSAGRRLSRPFTKVLQLMWLRSQLQELQQLATFALMALVWACVASMANAAGRTRDHNDPPLVHLAVINAALPTSYARRRRSKGKKPDHSGADMIAASYSRFSSDNQRDTSITDQQRKCTEAANSNAHRIQAELEFSDEAVSGTKLRRDGIDAMLRAAEDGEFKVLYVHSLSRLARESVITMPMLKRLVHTFGVRFISVTDGIDSARDGWELITSILSVMHERFIKELRENVFKGQEGTVLAGLAVGDHCFGYTSVPIPGSEVGRKGRNAKPRMAYVIDDVTAVWVIRIFNWFVAERRTLRWITRELNRRGAPKDHRSTTVAWHHTYVARLLASEKYIGTWPWGEARNVRDPFTGQVSQEQRPEEESDKWTRSFPHLRIIDDATFQQAQLLLDENFQRHVASRRQDGTLAGSRGNGTTPRHLLSQLIVCGGCGARFIVSGSRGKYLLCPRYARGLCQCKTQLLRSRAERIILQEIGSRILTSPAWFEAVCAAFQRSWQQQQAQLPDQLAVVKRELADVEWKVERLVDRVESGDQDPDIRKRLEKRRCEQQQLIHKRGQLQMADDQRLPAPTEAWVRQQLIHLETMLGNATPAAILALRNLVGGQIVVTEIRKEGRKRFHLRGEFSIRATSVARAMLQSIGSAATLGQDVMQTEEVERIVIDFVDPNPLDGPAEQAKALYDEGVINTLIAERMNCSKSQVTKLLKHWFQSRGEQMPNGWQRRGSLAVKHAEPAMFQRLAQPAIELWQEGKLMQDIASELNCDRTTVRAAIDFWHESRGLTHVDGRSRRAELERRGSDGGDTTERA